MDSFAAEDKSSSHGHVGRTFLNGFNKVACIGRGPMLNYTKIEKQLSMEK